MTDGSDTVRYTGIGQFGPAYAPTVNDFHPRLVLKTRYGSSMRWPTSVYPCNVPRSGGLLFLHL